MGFGTRSHRTCYPACRSNWSEGVKRRLVRGARLLLIVGAAALIGCSTAPPAAQPAPAAQPTPDPPPRSKADEPNTTDGIYTLAQAERGTQVYNRICSECHEPEDWTDVAFLERWEEASVFRLWYWIYERMPHGNPGSLTREQVTDALTYIFQLNGLPPGDTELGTDDDTIDDYWIIWTTP